MNKIQYFCDEKPVVIVRGYPPVVGSMVYFMRPAREDGTGLKKAKYKVSRVDVCLNMAFVNRDMYPLGTAENTLNYLKDHFGEVNGIRENGCLCAEQSFQVNMEEVNE